ncbi:jouberin-like [Homarus americanus]|uniref:Jouberin-like n=1 Tax=Homarus americanus TaxID=6706 RepID=A0A8J5NA74_HOMAM|nr:jouberin-like [Homarus americanus]XP_042240333.1 jouberin-like [Homarus americanus]XP_042240342.1 jouberin-like [Homarus americanus]KAG7176425.1 Jouberin-like [Homarus americanus]
MAVEDLEPLTRTDHDDEGETEERGKDTGETLNTLLTTALHKHAARKLGKKLNKKKKDEVKTEDNSHQETDKKKKKEKKSKTLKKKDKKDAIELQVVKETKDLKQSRQEKKNEVERQQEDDADQEQQGHRREEKSQIRHLQDLSKEDEGNERSGDEPEAAEHLTSAIVRSSTQEYLKAVSVPKKMPTVKSRRTTNSSDKVLGITVHCADRFEGSPLLLPHPVVQVHISNSDTGQWLQKLSKDRKVTSYYEGSEVDYILPIMTQPYDVKKERSLYCKWEEQLTINEPSNHFTSDEPQVLIFFQLMDFLTPSTCDSSAPSNQKLDSRNCGWITFAWAFLKIRGANNHVNIGQQLRLQLWRPRKSSKVELRDIYSWWKSGSRNKYPSTLHVTLQEVSIPQNPRPALRSMLATQQEQGGGTAFVEMLDQSSISGSSHSPIAGQNKPAVNWGRKPNQSCKILNSVKHCLSHTDKGCLVVKFSNDGLKLACGSYKQILIYDIITGQLEQALPGHLGLIYDISWSDNDYLLLTASADSTARIWHVDTGKECDQGQVLTHPSYVYVARFVPARSQVVVSGCYDHVLRVWSCSNSGRYSVAQELSNHLGFVNALCFNADGTILFSGDKQGVILVWSVDVPQKDKGKKKTKILTLQHEVKIRDIVGNIINSISFHPGGFRLLVHTRDSQLRLVNHKHWTITHRLRGLLNVREQVRGCVSPCGTWVISGSEDCGLYVWNSDTGDMTSAFMDLPINGTISCVDYHPHDNMMALCSYSSEAPVLILVYNQESLPANTTIPMSVQPAASGSLQTSLGGSPSPSQMPQKQPVYLSLNNQNHTMSNTMSSPVKCQSTSQELRDSEMKTFSYSQSVVERKTTIFAHSQYSKNSDQALRERRLLLHQGDKILQKLDLVLKMASEDPLNMSGSRMIGSKSEGVVPLGQLATVLYDYHSNETDELSVKQGDYVMVVQEINVDWWLVRTADSKATGLVPSSYLQQLPGELCQQQQDEMDSGKVIAVPSSSGDVSFISDVEGTPSKARARRHKVKAISAKIITSVPKSK